MRRRSFFGGARFVAAFASSTVGLLLLPGAVAAAIPPGGLYAGTSKNVLLGIRTNNAGKITFLEFSDKSAWRPKKFAHDCSTAAGDIATNDNALTLFPFRFSGRVKQNGHFAFKVVDHNGGDFTAKVTGAFVSPTTVSATVRVVSPIGIRTHHKFTPVKCDSGNQHLTLIKQ